MLKDMLPEIYQSLFAEEFLQLNPNEALAQCSDCYKTKKHAPQPHFDPQLKCCTYFPFLPNYLVGGIFCDSRYDSAQQILRSFIRHRNYITPLGVAPPPAYQEKFNNKMPGDFGNDQALTCPFFERSTGNCGVWRYRGHECLTYFCHSSYGPNGEEFWLKIREYLFRWEMFLSQSAFVELGHNHKWIDTALAYIKKSTYKDGEGWQLPTLVYTQLWAQAAGQEEDFFKRTFEFVKTNASRLQEEYYDEFEQSADDHPRFLHSLLMGRKV